MIPKQQDLNTQVQAYWQKEPCGTAADLTAGSEPGSLAYFQRIEERRYRLEPEIHAIAQFTRHRGKKLLEVGVGAGTDHLQWARAGLDCHGVDLTDAAIETTRKHLAHYGFTSKLQRVDAEHIPFETATFDLVYSWGVIHHSESPEKIVAEIHRVLRPGGQFVGMLYGRRSPLVFKKWVKHGLLKGRPWRSFADVVWSEVESVGTKAYTVAELRRMFGAFSQIEALPTITHWDRSGWPAWISAFFPNRWGWFVGIRAVK